MAFFLNHHACQGACKSPIPKDALRFGSAGEAMHGTYFWRCMECITPQQVIAAENMYESFESIPGMKELSDGTRQQ
jgi:hypothetical protein